MTLKTTILTSGTVGTLVMAILLIAKASAAVQAVVAIKTGGGM